MNNLEKLMPVTREKIETLEKQMQQFPQADCPVKHYFAPGMAAREMTIPAGVLITGAVHRHEHLCTISKGRIIVSTDDGMKELIAPCTLVSKAGAKRVGYAVEETVWTTYHATNETDIDKLIEEITESTTSELIGGSNNIQLLSQLAQKDYQHFLIEYGLTQELVTQLVENEFDQIGFPGWVAIEVRDSSIQGVGMFATKTIDKDEIIAPVRIGDKRTPAGRFINHSPNPNVAFKPSIDGGLDMYALRVLRQDEELLVDYRQAMNVNGAGFKPLGDMS
jgi:hypothetical protein